MRVLFIVRHLGIPKLEAVIEDEEKHRRKIVVRWEAREENPPLPPHWLAMIKAEVDYVRSKEAGPNLVDDLLVGGSE